jgi:hypothetical protein
MESEMSWLEVQETLKTKVRRLEIELRVDSGMKEGEIAITVMSQTTLMLALLRYITLLQTLPQQIALSNSGTLKTEVLSSFVLSVMANHIMSSCVPVKTWTDFLRRLPPITLSKMEIEVAFWNFFQCVDLVKEDTF